MTFRSRRRFPQKLRESSARQLARVIPEPEPDNGRPEGGIRLRDSGAGHRKIFLFSQFFAIVRPMIYSPLSGGRRKRNAFFFVVEIRDEIGVYSARNVRVLRSRFTVGERILGE